VINKVEDVGTGSVYRTFPYEVLAGPDDMKVTLSESDCEFSFDFSKVYWNSRLGTEHERIVDKFSGGEAVCDVMAGVGPFAVPAGKRKVFVWANDLNPDSVDGLERAIKRNKVQNFVYAFRMDGRQFISDSTAHLRERQRALKVLPDGKTFPAPGRRPSPHRMKQPRWAPPRDLIEPASFDHYVMNLPASAVEFLDAFRGLFAGREEEFYPKTNKRLPLIHVYCFGQKATDEEEQEAVCELVSKHLGRPITVNTPELEIHYVRLVSPKKKIFCVSFRLPAEVAF
jgi:tRNA (guanine37-N1)-methyltransferase